MAAAPVGARAPMAAASTRRAGYATVVWGRTGAAPQMPPPMADPGPGGTHPGPGTGRGSRAGAMKAAGEADGGTGVVSVRRAAAMATRSARSAVTSGTI